MYVADEGNGTISVIDTSTVAVVNTYAVAPANAGSPLPLPDRNSRPVALAELPNGTKIYSLNSGTNSVSSINTLDGFINKVIPLGGAPQWAVANPDNTHVYVIDSTGTISVIDARTDAVVSSVSAGRAGPRPNHIAYDPIFNRVFATSANSPQPSVSFFDVSGTSGNPNSTLVPHGPGTALITPAAGSTCASLPVPAAIAVLGDGSRAYVASYQDDGTQICTQATVINAAAGLVTTTVALAQTGLAANAVSQTNCDVSRFRVYATSSTGSTSSSFKVYVSQCDAGTVAIVDTFAVPTGPGTHPAEWLAGWLASPVSSFPGSQVHITGVSAPQVTCPTPTPVAYSYSLVGGPALQPGMTIYIGGMGIGANDGAFPIVTATSSSFTVTNTCPAPDGTAQNGTGSVLPPQNPVFLVPGP
jgi:YVTN family beta-propeller protein